MKMYNEINYLRKDYVYDSYTKIVDDFKDYEKITKVKMLDAIYKVYSDYNNIISLCTVRELKYLKKLIESQIDIKELEKEMEPNTPEEFEQFFKKIYKESKEKEKVAWEENCLRDKFLVRYDENHRYLVIPEEIIESVTKAITNVEWKEQKKIDELNEFLVSYIKIQGSALLNTVATIASQITGIDEKILWNHMLTNRLFKYYVFLTSEDFESIGKNIPVAVYQDYYYLLDELNYQRKKQGRATTKAIDISTYKTIFYHDFDINNKKIKKMLTELKKLPFYWPNALDRIKEYALLNIDRTDLKEAIENVPALSNYDLSSFFKDLDEAMDEIPSGALNGLTPNELKELEQEERKMNEKKEKSYTPQQNACLGAKESKLFYKLYFALLDFTNKKYKLKPNYKIYNQVGLNPYEITDIIDKFWENKDLVILEFCMSNPYKLNSTEIKLIEGFKKGIKDRFIIAKYEKEYTAFMSKDKIYMVKGLNDNIDNIIAYKNLPCFVETALIQFQDAIVYDGLLSSYPIDFGIGFTKTVEKEYDNLMKYYHL